MTTHKGYDDSTGCQDGGGRQGVDGGALTLKRSLKNGRIWRCAFSSEGYEKRRGIDLKNAGGTKFHKDCDGVCISNKMRTFWLGRYGSTGSVPWSRQGRLA